MNITETMQLLPNDLNIELQQLRQRLDQANNELTGHSLAWALSEDAYRAAKATSLIKFKTDEEYKKATIQHLEALIDDSCGNERRAAYLSRAQKEASLELVRSLRAQLSALQTIAASVRSEIELARGPEPRWTS